LGKGGGVPRLRVGSNVIEPLAPVGRTGHD
jgi:hypothetical protein